jgi:hypothetical protein
MPQGGRSCEHNPPTGCFRHEPDRQKPKTEEARNDSSAPPKPPGADPGPTAPPAAARPPARSLCRKRYRPRVRPAHWAALPALDAGRWSDSRAVLPFDPTLPGAIAETERCWLPGTVAACRTRALAGPESPTAPAPEARVKPRYLQPGPLSPPGTTRRAGRHLSFQAPTSRMASFCL